MTERLAEINARITGIGQLGEVVNAMRGIAAARAGQAQSQLAAADSHAATIASAIAEVLALFPAEASHPPAPAPARTAIVLFCAEQGFAGAFNEPIFRAITADLALSPLLVIGTRGQAKLAERGITPAWWAPMPPHTPSIPRLADRIAEAAYARIASGEISALDGVFCQRSPAHSLKLQRRRLLPLDPSGFHDGTAPNPPLLTLPPAALLQELTAEYLHAQLCAIALHAFAAENDARMEAMAQAHSQIDRQLTELKGVQRRVRQDEITAEIIDLAAGAEAMVERE